MSVCRSFMHLLAFNLILLFSPLLHAAGLSGAEVKAVRYPVWLESAEQKTPLTPGMRVRAADTIVTGKEARLLLTLPDGSEIKLGQLARLEINRLESKQRADGLDMQAALNLLQGHFRYVAGALTKLTSKRQLDLRLSTATIGIRGTDYWAMRDEQHDAVCLFEGAVDVRTQDQGVIALEQPSAFWVRYFDQPAQAPGNASAAQLAQFLGWIEVAPGSGVAIHNGRWRLLAGIEARVADARALKQVLYALGYPASVVKSGSNYEVQIDHFASRADAEAQLKRLQAEGGLLGTNPKVMLAR